MLVAIASQCNSAEGLRKGALLPYLLLTDSTTLQRISEFLFTVSTRITASILKQCTEKVDLDSEGEPHHVSSKVRTTTPKPIPQQ